MEEIFWHNFWLNIAQAGVLFVLGIVLIWMTVARLRSRLLVGRGQRSTLSVTGVMMLIAWIGLLCGVAQWFHANFATVYAPSYSEDQFARVQIGMERREIESLLGPPLRRDPYPSESWQHDDCWIYSQPSAPGLIGDNYWRRWIFFDRGHPGKVVAIVNDYYED